MLAEELEHVPHPPNGQDLSMELDKARARADKIDGKHAAEAERLSWQVMRISGVLVDLGMLLIQNIPQLLKSARDDVDINTSDTSTPTHNQISGRITRVRARQLNNQVSSVLASYSSYLDNGNMCSVLLLRNSGQERNGVAFVLVLLVLASSSIACRIGALVAGLLCSTRSRRPRELVYRSLRCSVPGQL
jgi:hypothetical protein